ncbi:MAG: RecQ family ATP-dependent DNA helicase [Bacteroidales bacterium]|jgi:ATP-dependent DNA helicase RecQ|nr:RecQ family ATP-dependent DNA helicase [Bacteroidales bacterium]
MNQFEQTLLKHWGYKQFRPLQLDIIQSVYKGHDTLGLMPTGGGKSITFQVYSLMKEGICIVVTPLIALMKDQVDNLKAKKIKAIAIYSGMSRREIDIAYDNCIYGEIKFLYISPERLGTQQFKEKIQHMNVNLITVDEAHCISQWGYDFRPSYLEIATIRELIPNTPVLALTATATADVVEDIQEKLQFKKKNVLTKSFERKNLTYLVKEKQDKLGFILSICNKIKGSGIVYVRTRKKTKEIASALIQKGLKADYYHAGLDSSTRQLKQEQWMKNPHGIMVSTNAFGMGIDKPNVRFVLHYDLPESLEAYFQEAGRAGRDGKESYAVLLFNKTDITSIKTHFTKKFPDIAYIKNVYEALGNYYQIPVGSGKGNAYDFFIAELCKTYKLDIIKTHNSIKILEEEGYFYVSESAETRSRVKFIVDRNSLYKFQIEHSNFDIFIKLLLRTYSGIFTEYVPISEDFLGKKVNAETELISKYLIALAKIGIISYYKAKQNPLIYYTEERIPQDTLYISKEKYDILKERQKNRLEALLQYVTNESKCRSLLLLDYFGEKNKTRCGNCDTCRKRNELRLSQTQFDNILEIIKKITQKESIPTHEIIQQIDAREEDILKVVNYLLDNKKITYTGAGRLLWNIS